jgi:hypothetical protein
LSGDKKDDQTKLMMADNVRDELAADLKDVLIFMGARYTPGSGKQHIEIVWQNALLASLDMNQKAMLLEALQKTAEYVATSITGGGASGVA